MCHRASRPRRGRSEERHAPGDFESLQVELGPSVRQHDRAAGIVVSDLRSVALNPGQARALAELPGRTCAELKALDPDARSLFELGVLTLRAAGG